mmetsp:Transcript_36520/g.66938  ORF Transcript_36520/g.66938 Transcript_36520/m.66938 type:complete len:147 (-) Transcript_36520:70-510(-)
MPLSAAFTQRLPGSACSDPAPVKSQEQVDVEADQRLRELVGAEKCLILSKQWCPWTPRAEMIIQRFSLERCHVVHLDDKGIESWEGAMERMVGSKKIPQIFLDHHYIGGYNDLRGLFKECREEDWTSENRQVCHFLTAALRGNSSK